MVSFLIHEFLTTRAFLKCGSSHHPWVHPVIPHLKGCCIRTSHCKHTKTHFIIQALLIKLCQESEMGLAVKKRPEGGKGLLDCGRSRTTPLWFFALLRTARSFFAWNMWCCRIDVADSCHGKNMDVCCPENKRLDSKDEGFQVRNLIFQLSMFRCHFSFLGLYTHLVFSFQVTKKHYLDVAQHY